MPFRIKAGLTVVVLLAAVAGFLFMGHLGKPGPQLAVLFLGPFTAISLWIFPEVMRSKADAKPTRRNFTGGAT